MNSKTTAEIAISIAAKLVQVRNSWNSLLFCPVITTYTLLKIC
jgi:hypothetical protein